MHISQFEITNVRCYQQVSADPSPAINLIVGENNSGKSTLLRCLLMLQSVTVIGDSIRYGANEAQIKIQLSDVAPSRFHESLRAHLENISTAEVRYRLLPPANIASPILVSSAGQIGFSPFSNTQPENFVETYLSTRTHGGLSEQVNLQLSSSVGGERNALVSKIDSCITSNFLRGPFLEACSNVLGFPIATWQTPGGKMAGIEINPKERSFVPLDRLGSGVTQALGLIVSLLVTEGKVFLMEELENDLHPSALRSLLVLIEQSARERGNQFFVSTHSSIVLRQLGSIPTTKIIQLVRTPNDPLTTTAQDVRATSQVRQALLQSLGYELVDLELWGAWLLLEESSAERIIREFIIPLFAPALSGRLRTVAAQGVDDVEPRFIDLHRLFLFIHLEPLYREKAWVIVDGDPRGRDLVSRLQATFKDWPQDHFSNFDQPEFERYYPECFSTVVKSVLSIEDRSIRREEKRKLCEQVVVWLREDRSRAKAELEKSAKHVIECIHRVEKNIVSTT